MHGSLAALSLDAATPAAILASSPALSTASDPANVGGLLGFAFTLIDALGEWGVGIFLFVETVFPPIPSELILPLAGFISGQGRMSLPLVIFTATLGGYLGALALYALGAMLGLERSIRWLSKIPLVDRADFEKAADWFVRHGAWAVFLGRLVPIVRSLVSLPAGASRMNLGLFSVFTLLGSGLWNSILIGFGAALGTQYALVAQYSDYLNYAVYVVIAGVVLFLVGRRLWRARSARRDA